MPTIRHAHRLRTGRYSVPGQVYLITSIVQNRDPVFKDFEQGRLVVDALRKAQQEELALSLACLLLLVFVSTPLMLTACQRRRPISHRQNQR